LTGRRGSESEEYHRWYYNTAAWKKTTWMRVECCKWVGDMWNYQEILGSSGFGVQLWVG